MGEIHLVGIQFSKFFISQGSRLCFDATGRFSGTLLHQCPQLFPCETSAFGKFLSKNIAVRSIVYIDPQSKQHEILKELRFKDVLDSKLADMFHSTRGAFWLMSSELPRLRQGQ
jgi:hypothetical protein